MKRPASREVQQLPMRRVTTARIMGSPEFARGFADVRAGVSFDWRVGSGDPNAAWGYERGRLLGYLAPLSMPLRIGGRINPESVALCKAALNRKLIV